MAFPLVGRKVGLYAGSGVGAVKVAALTTKSVAINNEPVDITGDDDSGFRTLLADPGIRSLDISFEGVAKDTDFLTIATGDGTTLLSDYELTFEGVGTIAGDFYLASVEFGAPHNEAVTLSGSLQSTGQFTFTAA